MAKRKVTRENFFVIQRYFRNNHTMAETEAKFGLSRFTIGMINKSSDYDDYISNIKEHKRHAFEQRKGVNNMFGKAVHIPDTDSSTTFKSSRETIYGSPFAETSIKEGVDGSKTIVQKPIQQDVVSLKKPQAQAPTVMVGPQPVRPLSTTQLIKACDEAKVGTPLKDIAEMLKFRDAAAFTYALKKDKASTDKFYAAFNEGEKRRTEIINKRRAEARKNTRVMGGVVKKKLTPYEKSVKSAAKNKNMTVEEYKQWQRDNLKKAREIKKEKEENAENSKAQEASAKQAVPARNERVEAAKRALEEELDKYAERNATAKMAVRVATDDERRRAELHDVQCSLLKSRARVNNGLAIALVLAGVAVLGISFAVIWRAING